MDTIQGVLAKRQELQDQVTQKTQELEAAKTELASFEADINARLAGATGATKAAPTKRAKVSGKATVKKAKKKVAKKKTAKKPATVAAKKVTKKVTKKKTAKKPAKKKVVAKKKAAPKKKAKTKGKKSATNSVTDASRKNAAEGRRAVATGERPTLKDSMKIVMGKKTMNAQGVVDALAKKKWLPASSDHRQYISFMLSNNCPETFERTETRGFYRVAKGAPAPATKNGNGKAKAKAKAKTKKSAAKGKKGPQAKPDPQVDAKLNKHWGINTDVATDPFKDAGGDATEAAPSEA